MSRSCGKFAAAVAIALVLRLLKRVTTQWRRRHWVGNRTFSGRRPYWRISRSPYVFTLNVLCCVYIELKYRGKRILFLSQYVSPCSYYSCNIIFQLQQPRGWRIRTSRFSHHSALLRSYPGIEYIDFPTGICCLFSLMTRYEMSTSCSPLFQTRAIHNRFELGGKTKCIVSILTMLTYIFLPTIAKKFSAFVFNTKCDAGSGPRLKKPEVLNRKFTGDIALDNRQRRTWNLARPVSLLLPKRTTECSYVAKFSSSSFCVVPSYFSVAVGIEHVHIVCDMMQRYRYFPPLRHTVSSFLVKQQHMTKEQRNQDAVRFHILDLFAICRTSTSSLSFKPCMIVKKIASSSAHAGTSPGHACEETYAVSPPFLTSDWWSKFTERSSNCLVDANYFR